MFQIQKDDSFWRPVHVRVPRDGGKVAVHVFKAKFRPLPHSRLKEIMEFAEAGPATGEDADPICEIVVDWDDVQDAEKKKLPFNAANLATLAEITYVRAAIFDSYWEAMSGKKYRAKNS